jgi:tRNA threonylcarbamoyladenosine biosynthesis protein TsaB
VSGGRWHLGLDTATPWLSLALWCPADGTVHRRQAHLGRALARALVGELATFLEAHGVGLREVAAVGVGVGPGSYTGVRIGVATALGLARGLGVPLGGAGTLEALALRGLDDGESAWVVLAARAGTVHAGRFVRRGDDVEVLEPVRARARDELALAPPVVEDVAPDALHAARQALAGRPPRPRYG